MEALMGELRWARTLTLLRSILTTQQRSFNVARNSDVITQNSHDTKTNFHYTTHNITAFHNIVHANMQHRGSKAIDNPRAQCCNLCKISLLIY